MNPILVFRFVGILVLFLGLSMTFPLGVSLIYKDGSAMSLVWSMLIAVCAGLLIYASTYKGDNKTLKHRDGVAIVTFGWIAAGLVGAVPFILSGSIHDFTNAYFESISGFTTTGATVLPHIEGVPKGILMWRSITQWFGGMGIIVLSIAILPFLGVGGMQLYKAEIPSPVVDKLKPRISDTAKTLWKVYLLITSLEIILLLLGGMSLFDSINHAFCTMPTGGFSPKNASIAHYDSAYLDGVVLVFMLLAGINFSLHYRLITGDSAVFGKDPECRIFLAMVCALIIVVTLNIHGAVYDSISKAFRYASFQVGSIITTTGFVTADYEKWPDLSRNLLVLCMFLGGMAGSTGGGLKTMRVILLVKHGFKEVFRIIHPHAVTSVKLGGKPVSSEILSSIWGFFILYLALFVAATLAMSALGLDLISSFASVAACIFNVGPGLGLVGPMHNYTGIPLIGKWILIFCMLLGRLEIYTVIVLLMPEYWRK
jgi:trk system potassium uptake protein TrkH